MPVDLETVTKLLEEVSPCKSDDLPFSPLSLLGLNETDTSRLLAFFLDVKEHHKAGRLFLEKFQKLINCTQFNIPLFSHPCVTTEKDLDQYGRADIVLEEDKYAIIIENKLFGARDQKDQLEDYGNWLKEHFPEGYLLVYLSDHNASDWSLPSESEHNAHYFQLDPTELAEKVFEPLISELEKTNKDYASFTKFFALYLRSFGMTKENKEIGEMIRKSYDSAVQISEQIYYVRENAFEGFYQKLKKRLGEKYLVSKLSEWNYNERYAEISVQKQEMPWCVGFGFEHRGYKDFYYGVRLLNLSHEELRQKLQKELLATSPKEYNQTRAWSWYVYDTYKGESVINSASYINEMLSPGCNGAFIDWAVEEVEKIFSKVENMGM